MPDDYDDSEIDDEGPVTQAEHDEDQGWTAADADILGPEPDYESEPEAPPNAAHASRLLGRLARIKHELEEAKEVADSERQSIDDWLEKRREQLGREVAWLEEALERYHQAVLARDPKKLSIPLPRGSLTSRMGQPEWEWEDEAAFVEWAREHAPEFVRQPDPPPPAPDKKALKAAGLRLVPIEDGDGAHRLVTADGEAVPGVRVMEAARVYAAKPSPLTTEEEDDGDEG